ncbi:MAG: hypothetical protein V1894_06360, partial [Chloroflexota bacterium]
MSDLRVFLIVILLSVAAWLVIPNLLTKRAMRKVIQAFRQNNITSAQNAKTPEELGLKPRSLLESLFSVRDYKPAELKLLMQADIIRETKDGRLYLSKEKL